MRLAFAIALAGWIVSAWGWQGAASRAAAAEAWAEAVEAEAQAWIEAVTGEARGAGR